VSDEEEAMDSSTAESQPVGAWLLFFVFGVLFAAYGVYQIVLPSVDPDHWRYYTTDADVIAYLADDFRATGGMEVVLGVLTMIVSVRWFRRADRWAWYAFWLFPLLFVWGMVTTWAIFVWLLLFMVAVGGLLRSFRRFFPADRHRPDLR
jgi:hypothetical protein